MHHLPQLKLKSVFYCGIHVQNAAEDMTAIATSGMWVKEEGRKPEEARANHQTKSMDICKTLREVRSIRKLEVSFVFFFSVVTVEEVTKR